MVGVQDAAVRVAGLVQDGISTGAWASLMVQFNAVLGGRDAVIRRAGSLSAVLNSGSEPVRAPFEVVCDGGVGAGERRLVRLAALQATRAASRSANQIQRLVLSGVERELLAASGSGGSVESALRGWGLAVGAGQPGCRRRRR